MIFFFSTLLHTVSIKAIYFLKKLVLTLFKIILILILTLVLILILILIFNKDYNKDKFI